MLGADLRAGAAVEAGIRRGGSAGQIEVNMLHLPVFPGVPGVFVVEGQISGNGQAHGAPRQAVTAGGAGSGGDGPDAVGGNLQPFQFMLS